MPALPALHAGVWLCRHCHVAARTTKGAPAVRHHRLANVSMSKPGYGDSVSESTTGLGVLPRLACLPLLFFLPFLAFLLSLHFSPFSPFLHLLASGWSSLATVVSAFLAARFAGLQTLQPFAECRHLLQPNLLPSLPMAVEGASCAAERSFQDCAAALKRSFPVNSGCHCLSCMWSDTHFW